jgi:hypothetical protein
MLGTTKEIVARRGARTQTSEASGDSFLYKLIMKTISFWCLSKRTLKGFVDNSEEELLLHKKRSALF